MFGKRRLRILLPAFCVELSCVTVALESVSIRDRDRLSTSLLVGPCCNPDCCSRSEDLMFETVHCL
jgi:hypothetical protein